jgi:TonB family protein
MTANLYRDSEGRTRREDVITSVDKSAAGNPEERQTTVTSIFDPVSAVRYKIDHNTRTVQKMTVTTPGYITLSDVKHLLKVSGGVLQGFAIKKVQPFYPAEAKAAQVQGAVQVQITINESGEVIEASAISGPQLLRDAATTAAKQWVFKPTEIEGRAVKVQGIVTFNFTLTDPNKKDEARVGAAPAKPLALSSVVLDGVIQQESLGKQMFDGVEAVGTRTIQTIPAGAIGNERPIESVTERWYSPELQTVIMTRHSDPRVGESIYRLTNINRGEPNASLFQPPAGYNFQEIKKKSPDANEQ